MTAARDRTPDAHLFPTRRYDLVKEFVVALLAMAVLTVGLAAVFSSPDEKAISLADWARAAPADVVATATGELAGTSASAGYGAPYNTADPGQRLGPLPLQRWGAVRTAVDSAKDLVLTPLAGVAHDPVLTASLGAWSSATPDQQAAWSTGYATALAAAPGGDPARVAAGHYGPVPVLAGRFRSLAAGGGLEGPSPPRRASTPATRPVRCCCSPTVHTWRTGPARSTWAVTSGG